MGTGIALYLETKNTTIIASARNSQRHQVQAAVERSRQSEEPLSDYHAAVSVGVSLDREDGSILAGTPGKK